mgnify:CR=1 FL=1
MSTEGLQLAQHKMADAGVGQTAINVFSHYYEQVETGATGLIAEDSITPISDPPRLDSVQVSEDQARDALSKTVFIKLNGGLGTSMGLDRAKSLLEVREGKSFLDIVVAQVLAARRKWGVRLPLLLMDSFNTHDDTLAALSRYPELPVGDLPLDFLQSKEPKLRADDLTPVSWPQDPDLEWCPPGHGDIYASLFDSGLIDRLLDAGYRYAAVSNSDNLGACPDARIAGWFADTGADWASEVCTRTVNDKKGGHLAIRKADGRLILRDTAQTSAEDMKYFTDETVHRYFHANNLWWNLVSLKAKLEERHGVLGLPLIRNTKTVDPTNSDSPEVIQVESAMGAAVELFDDARVILVGRDRFVPVKKTNELLLLRSDVYEIGDDGRLHAQVERIPGVDLGKPYKFVSEFDKRFPHPLGLREARALSVEGDWSFGRNVTVKGTVELGAEGGTVPDGAVLGEV